MAVSKTTLTNTGTNSERSIAKTHDPGLQRVAYLTDLVPSGKFGSLEEQIFNIARAFKDHGGLFLAVFGGPVVEEVRERYSNAGLKVEGLNLHNFSKQNLGMLLELLREYKITAIHWNFYSPINRYIWILTLLKPGLRHYITDHTSRILPLPEPTGGLKRITKKLLFKRYRKVWCISDFVVDCLEHAGTWSNVERCTYFINTDRFKPDAQVRETVRARLNAGDKFILLFVANVIPVKGGDVLIRALAELPDSVQLWVVGDGTDLPRLKALAAELDLEKKVVFLGNQNYVEPYMQGADCFVCPSLWGEAFGLVNLEAQASALPVVASDIGGIPEFVVNEKTGLLFPPGDSSQLANRINRLLNDKVLYERLSRFAREFAVDRFSIERRIEDYVRAYQ